MSGLPREILKWIQGLDLSHPVKNTRRDFSNGHLVAEIFSWYYPQEIQMHSYDNGTSLQTKMGNWSQLQRFFIRQGFDISKEVVDGTIHCKPRAATLLIENIYTLLTNRMIKTLQGDDEPDFTDTNYQAQLPAHARSTASMAIKNNIATTELSTDPDRILCQQKAQAIINNHVEHRRKERADDPYRFGIRPTLGELCPRSAPRPSHHLSRNAEEKDVQPQQQQQIQEQDSTFASDQSGQYTEVQVSQLQSDVLLPSLHSGALYNMVH